MDGFGKGSRLDPPELGEEKLRSGESAAPDGAGLGAAEG
jgi:hypothetical protein